MPNIYTYICIMVDSAVVLTCSVLRLDVVIFMFHVMEKCDICMYVRT